MDGWVKLHRKVLESDMYKSLNSKQRDVMITLLLMANHKSNKWEYKGEIYEAEPGQMVTSRASIRKNCAKDVTDQNLRTALKKLETWGFLTNKSTKTGRLITIVNWDIYQGSDTETNQVSNSQSTKDQPRANQELTPNKNVKNDKNEKKNDEIDDWLRDDSDSPEITEIQNLFINRANRFPSANDLHKMSEAVNNFPMETIRQGIDAAFEYKESQGETINSFAYCYKAIESLHRKKTMRGRNHGRNAAYRNVHGRNQTPDPVDKAATNPIWNLVQEA